MTSIMLKYCTMLAVGIWLMNLGLKIILTAMTPSGLNFVLREVSRHFHTDPMSIKNLEDLEAVSFTLYFLKEHNSRPDWTLTCEFELEENELDVLVRKARWLIDTNETLKAFYANLDAKFSNARWWERW